MVKESIKPMRFEKRITLVGLLAKLVLPLFTIEDFVRVKISNSPANGGYLIFEYISTYVPK